MKGSKDTLVCRGNGKTKMFMCVEAGHEYLRRYGRIWGFRSDGNHWNILARGMPYEIIFKGFKIDVVKRIG